MKNAIDGIDVHHALATCIPNYFDVMSEVKPSSSAKCISIKYFGIHRLILIKNMFWTKGPYLLCSIITNHFLLFYCNACHIKIQILKLWGPYLIIREFIAMTTVSLCLRKKIAYG